MGIGMKKCQSFVLLNFVRVLGYLIVHEVKVLRHLS